MTFYPVYPSSSVVELSELPAPSAGSDELRLLADNHRTVVEYNTSVGEGRATVSFERCILHHLGWPGDEILHAHPLTERGLRPYRALEVLRSGWLDAVIAGNAIHPGHNRARYDRLRHFAITFHDSTFECLAENYQVSVDQDGAN